MDSETVGPDPSCLGKKKKEGKKERRNRLLHPGKGRGGSVSVSSRGGVIRGGRDPRRASPLRKDAMWWLAVGGGGKKKRGGGSGLAWGEKKLPPTGACLKGMFSLCLSRRKERGGKEKKKRVPYNP